MTYRAVTNILIDNELIEHGEVVTADDLKTDTLSGEENLQILLEAGSVADDGTFYRAYPESAVEAATQASAAPVEEVSGEEKQSDGNK